MVSQVGHYAGHDFTAHARHSWTPRSGFVQRPLRTNSCGGAGEGAQLRINPENDSNGILAQVLSEAHSGDWIGPLAPVDFRSTANSQYPSQYIGGFDLL